MGKRKHVIPGTCHRCGYVPGCESRDLKPVERQALLDRGFTLGKDVFKRDIACGPKDRGNFNAALAHYHRAMCVPLSYPTWHERVLGTDP